jgi:hypothetical protein
MAPATSRRVLRPAALQLLGRLLRIRIEGSAARTAAVGGAHLRDQEEPEAEATLSGLAP